MTVFFKLAPVALVSLFVCLNGFPTVYAMTGTVCIESPATVTATSPCSANRSVVFSGPLTALNNHLVVGVYMEGSEPFSGFDITVKTDHTILAPIGVNFSQSLTQPSLAVIELCVQASLKEGTICAPTDTIDTVHLSATGTDHGPSPSTGLLFTITYVIVGKTGADGIGIGFSTGCPITSTSDGACVGIWSDTPTPDPEVVQSANFNNSATPTPPTPSIFDRALKTVADFFAPIGIALLGLGSFILWIGRWIVLGALGVGVLLFLAAISSGETDHSIGSSGPPYHYDPDAGSKWAEAHNRDLYLRMEEREIRRQRERE